MSIDSKRKLRCNTIESSLALSTGDIGSKYVVRRYTVRDQNFRTHDFFMIIRFDVISRMSPILGKHELAIDQRKPR